MTTSYQINAQSGDHIIFRLIERMAIIDHQDSNWSINQLINSQTNTWALSSFAWSHVITVIWCNIIYNITVEPPWSKHQCTTSILECSDKWNCLDKWISHKIHYTQYAPCMGKSKSSGVARPGPTRAVLYHQLSRPYHHEQARVTWFYNELDKIANYITSLAML